MRSRFLTFLRLNYAVAYPVGMCILLLTMAVPTFAQKSNTDSSAYTPSTRPIYYSEDRYGDPFSNGDNFDPAGDPSNLNVEIEADTSGNYTIYEKIGGLNYRPPSTMSFEDYRAYQERRMLKEYWKTRSKALDGESAVSDRFLNPKLFVSPVLDRIFGGSYVELIPRGMVTLDFGASFQRIANPSVPIRQQRNGGFEFDQQISMNVTGKVGEKLTVNADFSNGNTFDFQNNLKIEYTGYKEDLLQKLEIGNVSLPLNNTLIQGAQNLFGVKAQMQFGKLNVTTVASTFRGEVSTVSVDGDDDGQGRSFEIIASNYDENRHFFLGHFFRTHFRSWIANPPNIISGVNITRVEVYVINATSDTETTRNVVSLMDLGEGSVIYNGAVNSTNSSSPTDNDANDLYDYVTSLDRSPDKINSTLENYFEGSSNNGLVFEKISSARKLASTEYTYHSTLGYISLSVALDDDEALAVSYEYTYNGKAYQVGELSEDYSSLDDDEVIFMKMLRPSQVAIQDDDDVVIPTWELMMKNIYALGATELVSDGFELRVVYHDDASGLDNPQLQAGTTVRTRQLVEIMGLDELNTLNDRVADGNFDYIEGVTVNSDKGLIIFPYLKPFSEALRDAFDGESSESSLISKYCYDTLYGTTQASAELFSTKNKFYLTGEYTASNTSEILIPGFSVSEGTVTVYAGGIQLTEGTDYVVDYTFGKVTIINESILASGQDIDIEYEQSDAFSFQTKTLMGARFDYALSDDINLGSTFLYYNERATISRYTVGSEPARNMQYGVDFSMQKSSRMLTKMVDAIPGIDTKEESSITFNGEFAQLIPGTSNIVDGEGTGYIDDFENTSTPYSLLSAAAWDLSSVPASEDYAYDPSMGASDDVTAGYQRAKIAWYTIDNQLQRDGGALRPDNISNADLENHYVRMVGPQEIFPNKQLSTGEYYETILDIAYYPSERGPYNYNPDLTSQGLLNTDPEDNWGAITHAITTETDFNKANVEYIEFWLLDPFLDLGDNSKVLDGYFNKQNETGGKLVFQLGKISEDVTRDSYQAFENGLPTDGDLEGGETVSNSWGYVTTETYLTNSFSNTSSSARSNQDVGFDGLSDEGEQGYFTSFLANAPAVDNVTEDPSADDFYHFLDSKYDDMDAKILQRYKSYNGQDGNSPIASSSDSYTKSSYTTPDNEDINGDNTLDETETYYEYDVDLKPGLSLDSEYIVDKMTTDDTNDAGETVTWYLFRIPLQDYENKYGSIENFKTIQYLRMLLTDFEEPVVLRMANFRMVGSYWRRYTTDDLRDSGLQLEVEPDMDNFTVSVVSLEENGTADVSANKSAYVIPNGVVRDTDNSSSSTTSRYLNEQSVQLCVDELEDGNSRAIYKNLSVDLFNYGRIKMFYHLNSDSEDDEMYGFLRIGTDYTENYYEIQVPLTVSDPSDVTAAGVWPEENEIDLALDELYTLKIERNQAGASKTATYPTSGDGFKTVGHHKIRIMGSPDLSAVVGVMIGLRNPSSSDKASFTACMWANELRVTDFDRTPGYAVNTSATVKLADLGVVNGAFQYTSYGFGAISSQISERSREETTEYNVSASLNLDKFLPDNTGIKVPMYVSYENTLAMPSYDPANPDVKLKAALKAYSTTEEKQAYLDIVEDKTVQRSINFTNVRKEKTNPQAPVRPWDIENLAFSYSHSDANFHDFETAEQIYTRNKGGVVYSFQPKATGIQPFRNVKAFKSPWLKLLKDFNVGLMPSNLNVRLNLDRSYTSTSYRSTDSDGNYTEADPTFVKYFKFNRQYAMKWDLSKNLHVNYSATAGAVIDEPEGEIDTQAERDSIVSNLKKWGRLKTYVQDVTVNYALPLDKIPATDWLAVDYQHDIDYTWTAGTYNLPDSLTDDDDDLADSLDFKNTLTNGLAQNFAGKIDMTKLYKKSKFLSKLIDADKKKTAANQKNANTRGRPGVSVRAAKPDTTVTTREMPILIKALFKMLTSVKAINATYTITATTTLPGFIGTPRFLGMDREWATPGWGFVLGDQDPDYRWKAARSGMLTENSLLTTTYTQSRAVNLNLQATLQPTSDLRITLNATKTTTAGYSELFRYDPDESTDASGFAALSPSRSGTYKISSMALATAFDKSNTNLNSDVYSKFEDNLLIMQNRFRNINGLEYDTASQDVVIPAFIATYTGKDANTVSLTPFPSRPTPNWKVSYDGLGNLPGLKDKFQAVSLTHAYTCTYAVSSYTSSLDYTDANALELTNSIEKYNSDYYSESIDGEVVPIYVINQVVMTEQFAPLLGVSVRTKNRLTGSLAYKKSRTLTLTVSNAQLTEVNTKDISFEFGFTKNNLTLPFRAQGRTIVLKNDVTFRMNTTVSDTRTIQRKIDDTNTLTAGNVSVQIRPNISYVVNQQLTLQGYFTHTINEPLVSSSYRRTTTTAGLQVRFNLAQQ